MRVYETPLSKADETRISTELKKVWDGFFLVKCATQFSVDRILVDRAKKIRAWVEIKCRKAIRFAEYPHQWVDLHKYLSMVSIKRDTNLPVVLVYEFSDGIYLYHINDVPPDIEIGGRKDRRDRNDIKPVVKLSLEDWKKIV